jgi:predicted glycosyltransferase
MLQFSQAQEERIRRKLILSVLDAFEPHAIIVENRPLGMNDELTNILTRNDAKKIFLTRGIMTHQKWVRESYLSNDQQAALVEIFDKVIVATDRKIWDLYEEYEVPEAIVGKTEYVGYMGEAVDAAEIEKVRIERGVKKDDRWIVCSAGGGVDGEDLVREFISVLPELTNVIVDVIHGPHSTLPWPSALASTITENWGRRHQECRNLPVLHAAADLVVCPGGYNSLVEVMEGGAPAISISVQPDRDDEQSLRLSRLSRFYPIRVMENVAELRAAIAEMLPCCTVKKSIRERGSLGFDGVKKAKESILGTLSVSG